MHIAVIDDDREMREQMTAYIRRFSEETKKPYEISAFSSADALLKDYRPEYDILIFDIDMPGTNGMDAARKIREKDSRVTILFVTNMAQYAINGYEVEAVDYIIKPIGYYDFSMKFQRAVQKAAQKRPEKLVLATTEGTVQVNVSDIQYIEASAHYLIYHLPKRELRVRGSIKEHEEEMAQRHFSRVQRSFLVNLAHVEIINTTEVVVAGHRFSFGRAYREPFMADYMKYLGG